MEGKGNTFLSFLEGLLVLYEEFSRQEVSPKANNKPILPSRKRHSGIVQRERERVVCFKDGIHFHLDPTEEESRHYPADQVRGSQENLSTDLNWDM